MLRRGISDFKLDWFDNNNALIAAHENISKSIVLSYETILQGGEGIRKALKKIGFAIDLSVIKRSYRTQKNSEIVLTEKEERMYRFLKKLEKRSLK
jgi:hypothetical protein